MSEDPVETERSDQPLSSAAGTSPDDQTVFLSDGDIDAVLDDPTMSPEEKMARLEELRERVTHRDDEAYAPLSARLADAFSMLAQGGHSYTDNSTDPDKLIR
ncbi:MAG: hypothetical protein EON59_16155 [Alphaproteobacteria bacterium]|nr:MAG: hypothetical protein EON59_16155 [Alphaproteobacteria bacterium]